MSSDLTETVLFVPGGGYDHYSFVCAHAGCQHIGTSEFFSATGVDLLGFDNLDAEAEDVKRAFALERANGAASGVSPVSGPRFDRNKHGDIIWSAYNIEQAIRDPEVGGFLVQYDRFMDRIVVAERIAEDRYHPPRALDDDDAIRFIIHATRRGFKKDNTPFDTVDRAFRKVARDQSTDSAINWLTNLPEWDGVRRVDTFCSAYLGAEDTVYSRSVSRYWWTAHAGRVLDPGCQADAAVVLLSNQGTGKTSAVKAIVPYDEWFCELSFEAHDKDLSRAMRGRLVGELAEMRGMSSRDKESLKAWVSRRRETWTEKWEKYEGTFPRRLVLVGTTNIDDLFSDETGHRRWLPITVGGKQQIDQIVRDREQLWAEAALLWRDGGVQWREAQQLAKHEHISFESEELHDAWEETIVSWLRTEGLGGGRPADEDSLTIGRVLEDALRIEANRIQIRDQRRAGRILRKLGYEKKAVRDGSRVFKVWEKAKDV